MRFLICLLSVTLLGGIATAQKKYLVSPNQEVIPLPPAETPELIITKFTKAKIASIASTSCGQAPFGYEPLYCPHTAALGFTHKTVMGEWFVAPSDGTIDTFYFTCRQVAPAWALPDSTVYLRVFRSYITPARGPGVFPGPYRSPCVSWGYWVSTNDPDQGIAAFREDATDSTWHSTIEINGGTTPSYPPFGSSIWGFSGYPVKLKTTATGVNKVAMADLASLVVQKGDVFFFSLRMPSPTQEIYDSAWPTFFDISTCNASKPARDWKFYEHDSGTAICGNTPSEQMKRGWVARGPLSSDTNAGAVYNVWYVMTPTSNTPPSISLFGVVHNTLSTAPQSTSCEITDCDAGNPARAGVKSALIRYTFKDALGSTLASGDVPMSSLGFDEFQAIIPGAAKGTDVCYKIFAFDSTGQGDSTGNICYRIVDLNSAYYRVDTAFACAPASIVGSGTLIDTSAYFQVRGKNDAKGDDGTAGPFSLGGPFVYFGDTVNYAWIGVNGAIALSKTAAETLDVNSNGFPTFGFDLPQRQYHGRADTTNQRAGFMPKNFIAPYWSDWIVYQDSPRAAFGAIRWSNAGGKFIAEWDGVGAFFTGGPQPDIDTFRVVLDRAASTIQFQYPDIGTDGLDTTNLTGLNSDSLTHPGPITPFNYFNKKGYPAETRLHNGLCVSYHPVVYCASSLDGWNLVSVGDSSPHYEKSFLFPTAVSNAFKYQGGYISETTLAPCLGYWVKFSGAQQVCAVGKQVSCRDCDLAAGWNIVGSVSKPVPVGFVTTTPPNILSSPFFGFNGSYLVAGTIYPGKAYWVRASAPGTIHICAPAAEPKVAPVDQELAALNKLTVQDKSGHAQTLYIGSESVLSSEAASKYELPPPGPEGSLDVRYISQRLVEVYPSRIVRGTDYSYPISIQGAAYPLTVKWETARGSAENLLLMARVGNDTKTLGMMEGTGKVTISDARVARLLLKLTDGPAIPKAFALSQNYPNPYNPVTHFSVEIPRASVVDVTVYDVLGRKITTLLSGDQEAGYHILEWDSKDSHGLNVPSGMYMVRMTAGEFNAVRKIMLMK